jgi:hypothetical protein
MHTQGRKRFSSIREMANRFRAVIPVAVAALCLVMGGAAMAQININPSTVPAGPVGVPYNQNFSASGGAAPYVFSNEVGRLPNVLTLNPAGTLSGTPQLATVPFEVWVTDADGRESRANSSAWVISYGLTLTATFPNAAINQAYSAAIGVAGGVAPYTCSLFSGALPAGLTSASNCLISGTPTTAGTYTFSVQATDSVAGVGNQAFTLTVDKGNQSPLTVLSSKTSPPLSTTATLSTSGGSGTGSVSYASSNANCSINGNTLTAEAVGSCTVTATKAADSDYLAATATINITILPLTRPDAPTILSIATGHGQVIVTLQAPVNTGGGPLLRYTVTCQSNGAGQLPPVTGTSTTPTVVVAGMKPGALYSCTATVSNASFTSGPSLSSSAPPALSVDITPILTLILD